MIFKRLALGLAVAIILLGVVFIGLDILDIAEDYRLNLSIAVLNTIFIGPAGVLIVCFAARDFFFRGSPAMLGLSGAVIAFGSGILLYGWLTGAGLNTRIVAHDSGISLAGVIFFSSACLQTAGWDLAKSGPGQRLIILSAFYLVIITIIATVTWLAYQEIIDFLQPAVGAIGYRGIARGGTAVLCLASAYFYVRIYHRSHSDIFYWYSLGLILIACGVIFISQGALQSRTAWWGRVVEYAGFIYLFISAFTARALGAKDTLLRKNN